MSRLLVLPLSLLLSFGFAASAVAGPTEDQRAREAVRVLTEAQRIPESAIPDKLFDEARAIVVIPDALKVGLVFGGRRGHGLLSVKNPDGTWSNPAFVKLTGGSLGLQAGVQSADIVLVFRSERGLESIVNGKVTLGADAGVAAGPVGRNAGTATDGQLKAEIWSWSRARGLFAGIALDGAVLTIDDDANQLAYGNGSTPRMIFEGRTPQAAGGDVVAFRDALEEATALARDRRGTGTPAQARGRAQVAPVAPPAADPAAPSQSSPANAPSEPAPAPFEDVPADQGTRIEALPPEPTPASPAY